MGGLNYRECDEYVVDEVLNKKAYKHLEIEEGDVVLDLGAHVGSFVKYALDRGAARVIAVEMTKDTLELLRQNFGADERVTIVPAAVVSSKFEGLFAKQRNYKNPMSASIMPFNSEDPNGDVVQVVQITELLRAFNPTKLKFDIEGSEYDALLHDVEAVTASTVTRIMGELHTRTQEMYDLAVKFWVAYHSHGWWPSRDLEKFPGKPSGWNVIMYFVKEAQS